MTSNQYERLIKRYGKRIKAIVVAIKAALEEADYSCSEIYEDNGDEFSCGLLVYVSGTEDRPGNEDIDIRVSIIDGAEYDGEKNAVNFKLDVVEYLGFRSFSGI